MSPEVGGHTALSRDAREMVPVVLEVHALESHQTDHGSLLGRGGDLVGIKGFGDVRGRLLRGCALVGGRGTVAGIGSGRDGLELLRRELDLASLEGRRRRQQGHGERQQGVGNLARSHGEEDGMKRQK